MTMIEASNGFRAWGVAGVLFALPLVVAFLRFAWRRAMDNCAHVEGHVACAVAFVRGAWRAGYAEPLRINTWVAVALLAFVGLAGSAIFVSSNFMGGYTSKFLNAVMVPLWAGLSAGAWLVTLQTAHHRFSMALSCVLLLVVMLTAAAGLEGRG